MEQLRTTAFRRWRSDLKLTIQQAAEAIGMTDRMALYLDRGERKLQKRHQLVMEAAVRKIKLAPWQG